jgi:hypothetical protein
LNLGNVSVSLPDHPLLILLALEKQIRPLLLKEDKLLHAQEEADRTRIPLERFFLAFVTHIYGKRLGENTEQLTKLKSVVKKSHCNILTEVKLNGQIKIHALTKGRS